jgi:predicted CoA-binding protein
MNSKKSVENFLASKKIAVVGVSRNNRKFGNTVYRELKKKGYEVYPINPYAQTIDGDVCYPDITSIPEKPDAVLLSISQDKTEAIVEEILDAGIDKVWMQQGSQSEKAIKFCEDNNIDCVSNECILMFAQPTEFIHRTHRFFRGVFGKLPQ